MQSTSITVKLLARISAAVAYMAVVLFGFSDPIAAKGPVSATITGPGIDQPLELVDTADMALVTRLMEQTGLWYATGDLPRPIEEPTGELGPGYTLTWINGGPPDKSVDERTIRQVIYLHAEDGPIIHTPAQETLRNWGSGVIGWFSAPSGLLDTLAELGVPVTAASSSGVAAPLDVSAGPALPGSQPARAVPSLAVVGFIIFVVLAGALGARRLAMVR